MIFFTQPFLLDLLCVLSWNGCGYESFLDRPLLRHHPLYRLPRHHHVQLRRYKLSNHRNCSVILLSKPLVTWLDLSISQTFTESVITEAIHLSQCTMGKLQWEVGNRIFFIFDRELYLEYLDTDKMGGKVDESIWNIWMLLKGEAKLAHWSGTKWTDSVFYITDWMGIKESESL